MSRGAFRRLNAKFIHGIRDIHRIDLDKFKEWTQIHRLLRANDYQEAVENGAWETLVGLAKADLSARREDLQEMAQRQERLGSLFYQGRLLISSTKATGLWPITQFLDWANARPQLEQQLLARGYSSEDIAPALERLESPTLRDSIQDLDRAQSLLGDTLNGIAQKQITAIMRASLALAVARFNQRSSDDAPTVTPSVEQCKRTEAMLSAAEQSVWNGLRTGDLPATNAYAKGLAQMSAHALVKDVIPQAAALAFRRRSGTTNFTQDGRLALRLGDLIRSLLRAISLSQYSGWLSMWPAGLEPASEWIRQAQKLAFPSEIKWPPTARIAALAARPAESDGKALTIEGVLGPVTIKHRGRKAISSAPVMDEQGKSVQVTIPYIKLDSGGMVPGSYVRIAGVWQLLSKEVTGPALLIDRRDFGRLGRHSWSDWATTELRSFYEGVPHSLAASWSWEMGVDGAGNQLRYDTWHYQQED